MRNLTTALAVLIGCGQNWAQQPGGHATVPGRGGLWGGFNPVGSGVRNPAPASSTTSSPFSHRNPSPSDLIYPTPIGLQRTYSGYTGINRGAIPSEVRNGVANRRAGYGYGGFVLPFYSTFDSYPTPYYSWSQDPSTQSANVTANLLGEQVQRLTSEVEALRSERATAYPPPPAVYQDPPTPLVDDDAAQTVPLKLVLRNGVQVQLKSYAVMGQDVWDLTKQPAKRIPISSVDLSASKAATEAVGGEFPEMSH